MLQEEVSTEFFIKVSIPKSLQESGTNRVFLTKSIIPRWIQLPWLPCPQRRLLRWQWNVDRCPVQRPYRIFPMLKYMPRFISDIVVTGWVPRRIHPSSQQSQQIEGPTTMCLYCEVFPSSLHFPICFIILVIFRYIPDYVKIPPNSFRKMFHENYPLPRLN